MMLSLSLHRTIVLAVGPIDGAWRHGLAKILASLAIFAALISASELALAQFTQQGPKLIGAGETGKSEQGWSVAISADGSTMIEGGYADNSSVGAAWVFTRSGSTWTQQGGPLIANNASGAADQGVAVALSADGNIAIVGGYQDNSGVGAAWVFTRNGGVWTQQAKLIGSGNVGASGQGQAVALSADGNTAVLGGYEDNSGLGATWIFTRSGSTWTQQGAKLTSSSATAGAKQGVAVAVSGDGNTAIVGGSNDNSGVGAAWVYVRSGTTWSQQGGKLIGTGGTVAPGQGTSVALSADGNTALVGGEGDSNGVGAVWVYVRSGTTWSQQGAKLVGSGSSVISAQGRSVALSGNGNTAIEAGSGDGGDVGALWVFTRSGGTWSQQGSKLVGSGGSGQSYQGNAVALSRAGTTALAGGFYDNSEVGAVWVFAAPGFNPTTHDFNGDGTSDIGWRDSSGDTAIWLMQGATIQQGVSLGSVPDSWSIVGSRDFNGDGTTDILWRNTSGDTTMWLMSGGSIAQGTSIGNIPTVWSVVGTGDFNGDGKGDILWHDAGGDTTIWFMNGGTIAGTTGLGTVPLIWSVAGVGDFNGDGTSDILWHDIYGDVSVWEMSGGSIKQGVSLGNVATNWSIVGTGDFNSDGTSDVLWRDTAGDVMIWLIHNGALLQQSVLGNVATTWSVAETGDYNGDGYSDILWIDTSGNLMIWYMNGLTVTSAVSYGNVGTPWSVQGAHAD